MTFIKEAEHLWKKVIVYDATPINTNNLDANEKNQLIKNQKTLPKQGLILTNQWYTFILPTPARDASFRAT